MSSGPFFTIFIGNLYKFNMKKVRWTFDSAAENKIVVCEWCDL